jgi:flavin reductase (DIM6/NTAB) family NADH-FMN oxidoreductase RutF
LYAVSSLFRGLDNPRVGVLKMGTDSPLGTYDGSAPGGSSGLTAPADTSRARPGTPLERMDAALEPLALRGLLGHFATGVTVLTCRSASGADIGVTISALAPVSLSPPLLLVCVQLGAQVCRRLMTAIDFAINVLASDQEALARRFAQRCDERFAGVTVTRGKTGAALLQGALAHFECRLVSTQEAGDHAIVIGEIISGSGRPGNPLLHFRGSFTQATPADRPVLGERLLENSD